ncbi:MAG: prohibitin family protein, partial [Flavobacteriales bacterium]|nr:prohibitin family protein [Flavobacteriales bacterium]
MEPKQRKLIITLIVAFFGAVIIWQTSTVTIRSGEAGVLYRTFGGGTVTDFYFSEGFHFISPWNSMFVYSTRNMEQREIMEALSKNGLQIQIEMSIRYRPIASELGTIHQTIGVNYKDVIVMPEVRSASRQVIGRY